MHPVRRLPGWTLPACLALLASTATAGGQESKAPPLALTGAKAFRVAVGELPSDTADPLDPASPAWEKASPTRLILSRTPRIYQTEPTKQPAPPAAEVRVLRRGDSLLVRLAWDDATENAPKAPEAKTGEAGDPKILYKKPTAETSTFSDAVAVMVPEDWKGPAFPSLVMGDEKAPALLYHWSASRGTNVLEAKGRASTTRLERSFPARGVYQNGKWTAVLEVPSPTLDAGYPVAFAVWDGASGDRDGLKFFSTWHVLAPQRSASAPTPGAAP